MAIEFQVKIEGLDKLKKNFMKAPKDVYDALTRAINISALTIVQDVKAVTPKKTTALAGSIRAQFSRLKAIIAPHKDYAIYVHEGTGIYGKHHTPIVPTTKKALYWKGALHPVRSVKGMPGRPFMQQGLDSAKPKVESTFRKEVDKVLTIIVTK